MQLLFFSLIAIASAKSDSLPAFRTAAVPYLHFSTDQYTGRAHRGWEGGLFKAAVYLERQRPMARSKYWDRLRNGTMICTYNDGQKQSRAVYTPRGAWAETIQGYPGKLLNSDAVGDIKAMYGEGTQIGYVYEVSTRKGEKVCFVLIKTGPFRKRIRIDENGIVVIQQFDADVEDSGELAGR